MQKPQDVLDLRGKGCPLPVLDIYYHLKQLKSGGTLCILTSNPDSPRNFRAFCRQSGHVFVDARRQGEDVAIYIRKAKRPH
jgi:tRNA 2-thiouridine synthesizing protein A